MGAGDVWELTCGDDVETQLAAMQRMIDDGSIWRLEGSMGRAAMDAIERGDCMLGPKPVRDYWGNLVPAWWMVEPGSKGSPGFANYDPADFERPTEAEQRELYAAIGVEVR